MVKPTICLNFICKDEEHCIEKMLNNVCEKLPISYIVGVDTGSTDKTVEIIENFLKDNKWNIKGELHHREWKNFGHNRTEALELCKDKCEFIWIMDCDDEIRGDVVLPEVMDKDAYQIKMSTCPNFYYSRPLLVRSDKNWRYRGVLHEFIHTDVPFTAEVIDNEFFVFGGTINNDNEKYKGDAELLKNHLENLPEDEKDIESRYTYYMGQSYRDAQIHKEAIEAFKKRVDLDGKCAIDNKGEVYISLYEIGMCYIKLDEIDRALTYMFQAHAYDPQRSEAVVMILKLMRMNNIVEPAYQFMKTYDIRNLDLPDNAKLFHNTNMSKFGFSFECIILSLLMSDYNVIEHLMRIWKYRDIVPKNVMELTKEIICEFEKAAIGIYKAKFIILKKIYGIPLNNDIHSKKEVSGPNSELQTLQPIKGEIKL